MQRRSSRRSIPPTPWPRPRQRAVLIVTELLGWSAAEAALLVDASVPANAGPQAVMTIETLIAISEAG